MSTTEQHRLSTDHAAWIRWGPYLAERAWGTVREDYSDNGDAWSYFPFEQARSRAFRWSEDGLGGVSDIRQHLCLAFAFWNGQDPILKERIFGLTGQEGNHGEDAKELWWYLDNTPSHAWMRWRYLYPQAAFPYEGLRTENARRSRLEPEYELLDTGVLDGGRYWEIEARYAKASPDDVCIRLTARNAGPTAATLHVLPTLWFRNTWSWGLDGRVPAIRSDGNTLIADHHDLGRRVLTASGSPVALVCDNDTNAERLFGVPSTTPWPKDGIGDHVVHGAATVNPAGVGTKAALWYVLEVPAGASVALDLRFAPEAAPAGPAFEEVLAEREAEADAFHASLLPADATGDEALVVRQAYAGLLWSKQYYHLDVERWLDGDPAGPEPPRRREHGRNSEWRHLNNADIISMPDTWEYPWYASWDLAFHCVPLARLDPSFAKHQLLLLCREWYMHPNGQLPAYEWAFGDVNPPVHAWAALRVFEVDGSTDYRFLERVFHKLLLNFTWWVNRKDAAGNNVFEGGFLGLDNIGPIDRSAHLPVDGILEQSDGTAWMGMYCLTMLDIAITLASHDPSYEDLATKFFEHFAYIADAMTEQGLWDDQDGFSYDVIKGSTGERTPLRVRSMVGLLPLCATTTLPREVLARLPDFTGRLEWFVANRPQYAEHIAHVRDENGHEDRLLSILGPERLRRVLARMLDEGEFLSPYGLRSLSRHHADHPFVLDLCGVTAQVDYEPAESRTAMFGGNSNWRGPIWFPLNHLLVEALRRYDRFYGDSLRVEHPTGSGTPVRLSAVADDLDRRLISLFLTGSDGRRPSFGPSGPFLRASGSGDALWFFEYFHGDTGAGLGASHQTGWTALVSEHIVGRAGR